MSRDSRERCPELAHYRGRAVALTRMFARAYKRQFVRTTHHQRITSPLVTTEIEALINSWRRDLRARNLARKTIKTYGESANQLVAHLAEAGVTEAQAVTREHVSDFITDLLATRSPSTASVRFRALQQFFMWLLDEEEITVSPMSKLRPPKIPEQLTPVLDDAAIRSLLKACAGKDFADFRDTAIVRLFLDTGMRLDELAKLRVDDVDLDYDNTATLLGKRPPAPHLPVRRQDSPCPGPLPSPASPPEASRRPEALARRQRPRRHDRQRHRPGDPQARCRSRHPWAAPIYSATPLPTSGAWPATTTPSCASSAGAPARCSTATAPLPRMPEPERRTSASCPAIAFEPRASTGTSRGSARPPWAGRDAGRSAAEVATMH
jgi:integrase